MIRIIIGIAIGVYITQNYQVPDITTWAKFIQKQMADYEKGLPKKND